LTPIFIFKKLKACALHTGIHAFLQTASRAASACCLTYFLATAQESKHKMVGNHFEHLKDGPQGEIPGRIS
jgi:hypothetical protein